VLLDDATRLAATGPAADVAVQLDVTPGVPHVLLDVTPGVPHVFQSFAGLLDDGEAALTSAGAFLQVRFELAL
jgi:monoterpene epsilon-lactone hydrolase